MAVDTFTTSASGLTFTGYAALNLSGVVIDELRITLDAGSSLAEGIDNLELTNVDAPEPGVAVLLAPGLVGVGAAARRR